MRKKSHNLALSVGLVLGLTALTLGIVSGLFGGGVKSVLAGPEDSGQSKIYFPWVPNDATVGGVDDVNGAITVQNVEIFPVHVTISDAAGDELESITLNPRASQTFTAESLGLPDGDGAGVVASATWAVDEDDLVNAHMCEEDEGEVAIPVKRGTADSDDDTFKVPENAIFPDGLGYSIRIKEVRQGNNVYTEDEDFDVEGVDAANGTATFRWLDNARPAEGTEYVVVLETVDYVCPEPRIAGVAKTTVDTTGVRTNSDTDMVDGYSAVPYSDVLLAKTGGAELEKQSRWILPIVQTNNGWNTEFVITNFGSKTANVNATFYVVDGQGVGGEAEVFVNKALKAGESVRFDLDDEDVEEGTIGSVWIDSDQDVTAVAFRVKESTDMMLTNVAQPRYDGDGAEVKYAPLVFRDYNGWNTGINIANLSSELNQVTVTLYNYSGNVVGTERIMINPRAMEYVYMPATGEIGLGENQISSAKIVGTDAIAVAVDEVKYLGGQGEGHAMSYLAAGSIDSRVIQDWDWDIPSNPFNRQVVDGRVHYGAALSLPLVQKGNERTGSGDTSGINLFNSNNTFGVQAHVQFLSSSGVPVAPTVAADDSESPIIFEMPAGAGATIYTLNYSEMPAGFQGSAVVGVVANVGLGEINLGSLVGVSNNVNYDVDGDGSAVFNLVNTYNYSFLDSVCRAIGTPVPGSPTPVPPFCLD